MLEERFNEYFLVRIIWTDAAPDDVTRVKRFAYYRELIAQWAAEGLRLPQIAKKLNEMGLRTRLGREWSRDTLYRVVANAGIEVTRARRRPANRG